MKLHLPALYQNNQDVFEIKPSLIKNFEKLKSTATFYKVPFKAIAAKMAFILSITFIGQLFFHLIGF